MKRLAAAVLALVLLLSVSVPALAEDGGPPFTIMPHAPGVLPEETARALELAALYYTDRQPDSWEDILAMYALGLDVSSLAVPDGLNLYAGILCAAADGDPYPLSEELALRQGEDGAFGDSLTDHIYAMLALKIAPVDAYDADAAMAYLLAQQAEDGGFEAWGGVAEPTGLALLVLEGEAAGTAAAFLLACMTEDGGWIGYPEWTDEPDACTAATAISGLLAAGAEVPPEAVGHLLSYQEEETGAFRFTAGGEADPDFATPQAVRVLGELVYGSVYARLAEAVNPPEPPERPYGPVYSDWDAIPQWGREAAGFALTSGLMVGDELYRFLPDVNITRSQLAAILMKLNLGAETAEGFETEYEDVGGAWFADAVVYVSERGLMGGYGGFFRPHDPLTREQIAFVLARALNLVVTIEDREPSDIGAADPAFADAVRAVFTEGIMVGNDGRFDPKGEFSRLELAGLLMNLHR
ncbi:MAG: S-layer homology domain-containing protein [Oscillospiraceae bacterium]|nr:S-layer homology domain-containing protein [Oscillospiraceae bacterium]